LSLERSSHPDLGIKNVGINLAPIATLLVDGGTRVLASLTMGWRHRGGHDHDGALSRWRRCQWVGVNVGSTVTIFAADNPRSLVVSAA